MSFVTAHLEIFLPSSIIPESDLYFTSCSAFNALSKEHQNNCKCINKVTVSDFGD